MIAPQSLSRSRVAARDASSAAVTRERLLSAAAQLLAERGFEAVSIRAVTRRAGLSVSAAHYHFGSKDALVREALRDRIAPLNAIRLERLDALEAQGDPTLEAVLDALLRPALEFSAAEGEGAASYRRLPAILHQASPELVRELFDEIFGEVVRRFLAALERALPGRELRGLPLAFQLCVGSMLHLTGGRVELYLAEQSPIASERGLDCLLRFTAAGLRAACPPRDPVPAAAETGR